MNTPKENSPTDKTTAKSKRYVFAQRNEDDFTCIKIIDGVYEGIIYKYNKVSFEQKPLDGGDIPLRFTYDIMVNPNELDVESLDFRNYIGDILVEIVDQQLREGKLQINE